MSNLRVDWRSFGAIAGAATIGAIWAGYNLWMAGGSREPAVFRELIWAVFATPFAAFFGWAWARPDERWRAAFVCFCIYFFSIFAGARLERLVLGEEVATATKHALYYRATLACDWLACLGVALQRARAVGTIPGSQEPVAHSTSQQL